MLMGKRPPPHMTRTTSMTGFELDVDPMEVADAPQPSDGLRGDFLATGHVASSSPRSRSRRSSGDFVPIEIAPFLKSCGLCSRRLRPGKDIYMYRGEIAFCSLECREQQIKKDESIEKHAFSAVGMETTSAAATGAAGTDATGDTVAMA